MTEQIQSSQTGEKKAMPAPDRPEAAPLKAPAATPVKKAGGATNTVAAILQDSASNPTTYVKQWVVPGGGE